MKSLLPFLAYTCLIFVTVFLPACKKDVGNATSISKNISADQRIDVPGDDESLFNTFYGPAIQIGDGHMRSWVNIDHTGKPSAIGVEITGEALVNLPHDVESFSEVSFILPLHQKAKDLTPYDHLEIDWNEHGHEPPGIYDLAHFDFHFYMMTLSEQMAIPPYEEAPALFDNLPPSEYLPSFYFRGPGGVPQMGVHWVDLLSPEFNGQLFTSTVLYGTYDGRVTFLEPMITMDVIQSGTTVHKQIRQPQRFSPENKYYPTELAIWRDASTGRHYVSLNSMVLRLF
jgi:hypothetical protein